MTPNPFMLGIIALTLLSMGGAHALGQRPAPRAQSRIDATWTMRTNWNRQPPQPGCGVKLAADETYQL